MYEDRFRGYGSVISVSACQSLEALVVVALMSLALTCEAVRYCVTRLPVLFGAKAIRDATMIEKAVSEQDRVCRVQDAEEEKRKG